MVNIISLVFMELQKQILGKDEKTGLPMKKFSLVTSLFLLVMILLSGKPIDCQAKDISWTVTQYGSDNDSAQSMFYTVKGSNGRLFVIDGGWASNEARVRKVIRKNGGKVDGWIITHPHPDHVGAFNKIKSNPQGIKIGYVLAPKINAERYNTYKYSWDEYPVFTEFMSLVSNYPKIKWIKPGKTMRLYGLNMKFFNSYSNDINDTTKDICNGSSLVFKIYGKKTSMLFTGDIISPNGKRLMKEYGSELKATYLQAPHHGNNRGRKSFFTYIHPKVTFIDAQASLRNSNAAIQENIHILKGLGSKIYSFDHRKGVIIH